MNRDQRNENFSIAGIIIGFVVVLILLFGSFYTVKSSERGVISTLGKVRDEPADAGLHLKWPIIQKVKRMSIQTQKMSKSESAYTKDIQNTEVTLEINYDLIPTSFPPCIGKLARVMRRSC